MDNTIKKLVEENPNDSILGQKVREMYWQLTKEHTDPNQLTIQFPTDEALNS